MYFASDVAATRVSHVHDALRRRGGFLIHSNDYGISTALIIHPAVHNTCHLVAVEVNKADSIKLYTIIKLNVK